MLSAPARNKKSRIHGSYIRRGVALYPRTGSCCELRPLFSLLSFFFFESFRGATVRSSERGARQRAPARRNLHAFACVVRAKANARCAAHNERSQKDTTEQETNVVPFKDTQCSASVLRTMQAGAFWRAGAMFAHEHGMHAPTRPFTLDTNFACDTEARLAILSKAPPPAVYFV